MLRDSRAAYKTWVEVSAQNLKHNIKVLKKSVGNKVVLMPILKANAYGHGLEVCAKIAGSATEAAIIGVDSVDEALLVASVSKKPILILGYVPESRLREVVKFNFRIAAYNIEIINALAAISRRLKKQAYIHLKIESGTYRQGVMPEHIAAFAKQLAKHAKEVNVEGAYTHFSDTENIKSDYHRYQMKVFSDALLILQENGIKPSLTHAAASAAVFMYPDTHFELARSGISLYGMYPSKDVQSRMPRKEELKPVLAWKTRVAQIKNIPPQATVGYARTYSAKSQMQIAILPVGYWDGFDRGFSNKGVVLIKNKRAPVVGNICMNICMVDVTGMKGLKAGDEAVLLGRQGREVITAEELAALAGTINYEIVTRINPLIPRIVV